MAANKGRPGGRAGITKTRSRRAASQRRQRNPEPVTGLEVSRKRSRSTSVKPAGRGGARQRAGGPRHRGLDPGEDRNP